MLLLFLLPMFFLFVSFQKMKGLMRKRSTTAARLQRAFSAKGLRGPHADNQHNNNKDAANNNNSNNGSPGGGLPPNRTREGRPKRQFIMETPATFTTVSIMSVRRRDPVRVCIPEGFTHTQKGDVRTRKQIEVNIRSQASKQQKRKHVCINKHQKAQASKQTQG